MLLKNLISSSLQKVRVQHLKIAFEGIDWLWTIGSGDFCLKRQYCTGAYLNSCFMHKGVCFNPIALVVPAISVKDVLVKNSDNIQGVPSVALTIHSL